MGEQGEWHRKGAPGWLWLSGKRSSKDSFIQNLCSGF